MRARAGIAGAVGLVMVAVAGCGSTTTSIAPTGTQPGASTTSAAPAGTAPGASGRSPTPGVTSPPSQGAPSTTTVTTGPVVVAVLPVLPPGGLTGLTRLPWSAPTVDGSTVRVHVTVGGCKGPPVGATVTDAAASVTLTLYDRVGPGPICPDNVGNFSVAVVLPSAIGTRALVAG